jgi:hypothetical protein
MLQSWIHNVERILIQLKRYIMHGIPGISFFCFCLWPGRINGWIFQICSPSAIASAAREMVPCEGMLLNMPFQVRWAPGTAHRGWERVWLIFRDQIGYDRWQERQVRLRYYSLLKHAKILQEINPLPDGLYFCDKKEPLKCFSSACPNHEIRYKFLLKNLLVGTCSYFCRPWSH